MDQATINLLNRLQVQDRCWSSELFQLPEIKNKTQVVIF